MKTYITFGCGHSHILKDGRVLTHRTVAVIHHEKEADGRAIAFRLFGPAFCFEYPDYAWDNNPIRLAKYFPDGYVDIHPKDYDELPPHHTDGCCRGE